MLKKDEQVGEYVLVEKLGSGGFGEVWKAEKRTVLSVSQFAIKFFRTDDDKEIDLDTVRREVEIWQRLSGLPHIISVIEGNKFEDYVYIVSEFADGGSLDKWIRAHGGQANSHGEAMAIVGQILQGLESMHGEGFVHRDLKPANILVKRNLLYLADFGISRQMKTHSKTSGTAGTYDYMPPEAFDGQPVVSIHTDIWAAGVLLQKLLTGAMPFPQTDIPSLMGAIIMREPEPMPSVPYGLQEVVKKALQKDRRDRFQSAREMRDALSTALTNPQQLVFPKPSTDSIVTKIDHKIPEPPVEETQDWRVVEAERQRRLEEARRSKEADDARRLKEADDARRRQEDAAEQERQRLEAERRQKELDDNMRRGLLSPPPKKNNALIIVAVLLGIFLGIPLVAILAIAIVRENMPELFNKNANSANNRPANIPQNKPGNISNNSGSNISKSNSTNQQTVAGSVDMQFVKVPSGSFMMGAPASEKDSFDSERPQHKVFISKDFYLGKYEVTQGQWKAVMGSNPSQFKECGDNCPVENVSWNDVQDFIRKLNARGEGTYRLPTEAEWEYACRAGTVGEYGGTGNLDEMGWYVKNSDNKPHPVGQKKANAFGLYDMHGNVHEWVQDWDGAYLNFDVTDPTGPTTGQKRLIRGGDFRSGHLGGLRSAFRFGFDPTSSGYDRGFRLVRQ